MIPFLTLGCLTEIISGSLQSNIRNVPCSRSAIHVQSSTLPCSIYQTLPSPQKGNLSKISPTYPWKIPKRPFTNSSWRSFFLCAGLGKSGGIFPGYVGKIIDPVNSWRLAVCQVMPLLWRSESPTLRNRWQLEFGGIARDHLSYRHDRHSFELLQSFVWYTPKMLDLSHMIWIDSIVGHRYMLKIKREIFM